ncbi:hypothetical protein HanRHA438_Chr08g0371811 [Helianthus annuus]|nr:hypothetical protein HanRHA438_Chr08g0371811 [Helianthus annuus]
MPLSDFNRSPLSPENLPPSLLRLRFLSLLGLSLFCFVAAAPPPDGGGGDPFCKSKRGSEAMWDCRNPRWFPDR